MTIKYVLIRPRAGFNDILNQIVRSVEWARVLGRLSIIDARWGTWADDLSHYFEPRDVWRDVRLSIDGTRLSGLSVAPGFLQNDLSTAYRVKLVRDDANRLRPIEPITGTELSARVVPDIRADVLLDHPVGGGSRGLEFLKSVRFSSDLRSYFAEDLSQLPASYNALHVRNTDLSADLDDAVRQIRGLDPSTPVFVASDAETTLELLQDRIPEWDLFSHGKHFSQGRRTSGALHLDAQIPPRQRNLEMLRDLITLALSHDLCTSKLAVGQQKRRSGFSQLAVSLHESPAVVADLLGREPSPEWTRRKM